jgi:hypothetical protein
LKIGGTNPLRQKGTAGNGGLITFFLFPRSEAMGNDGGSIPKRIELVKEKKKAAIQNPDIERKALWFFCALSKVSTIDPLRNIN